MLCLVDKKYEGKKYGNTKKKKFKINKTNYVFLDFKLVTGTWKIEKNL